MTTSSAQSVGRDDDGAIDPRPGIAARAKRWPAWRHAAAAGRLGLPLTASIAAHIGLGLFLAYSAWTFRAELAGGKTRGEVVISLPPAPPPASPASAPGEYAPAPVAPVHEEPPRLSGLATREAVSPPTLRSSATEIPSATDLLKRRDDSGIGATFAGLGARQATRIVYVVDASGAMVTSLKFVLAEVERSVRSLSSGQKFQVVLFRDRPGAEGGPYEVFGGGAGGRARLVAATPQNKAALSRWLQTVQPLGRSNPLDGLKRGLEFDPDAVFLLSRSIRRSGADSAWGGRSADDTLAELDRLNPRQAQNGRRRVVVKAIQFLEEDPTGTMQRIGNEHGDGPGSYSVLTLQALGAR